MTMTATAAKQETFEILSKYIDFGMAIVPIWGIVDVDICACPLGKDCTKSKGKHPNAKLVPAGVKHATRDKAILREWVNRFPNGNWAVRCGEALTEGGYLLVFDEDPRNGAIEAKAGLPALPLTPTQDTGGGGHHYFFKTNEPISSCGVGPGLELQGIGKYVLVEPSKHFSGGVYTWSFGQSLVDLSIPHAPEWLIQSASEKAGARPARFGDDTARDTVLGEAFALAEMLGPVMPDGICYVKCPWWDQHSDARGRGEDSSTVILPPAGGSRFGGFKCAHSHCSHRKWDDVIKALPTSAVEAAKQKFPLRPIAVVEDEAAPLIASPRSELDLCRDKLAFNTTKGGHKLKNDIVNAISILTYDPRWKGILKYDVFGQNLKFSSPPPWHSDDMPKEQKDYWGDKDEDRLDSWFRRYWALELPSMACATAAFIVGQKNSFHPLRDWLDLLVWDGEKRLDKWLIEYLGVSNTTYARTVGSKWCISAVARAYQPGCKVDHVLILEGPQGRGKSKALAELIGREWFSDTPLDLGNKDAYLSLRGKWGIELAELASLKKADQDRIKAFFTSPSDHYRPPYGRIPESFPRTCIFCGTINLDEYLKDETGNRRYWPVKCGTLDHERLAADREQIWAEAVMLYKSWVERGSKLSECLWWPTENETIDMVVEQETRQVDNVDIWEETITRWTHGEAARRLIESNGGLSTEQILRFGLNLDVNKCGLAEKIRIGRVMMNGLKWRKIRARYSKTREYLYAPLSP